MPISSDIELLALPSSHDARPFQSPLRGQSVQSSTSVSETNPENRTSNPNSTAAVVVDHGIQPPAPAYFPPSTVPPTPSSDAGLLEYNRLHGHSETPLSPRQREDDLSSVQASEAHGSDALPAYKTENPPVYSRRPDNEPTTWPMICFKLGFLFPIFWLFGALTLVTTQNSALSRIFVPWFRDFAPSLEPQLDDNLQTGEHLARVRTAERRWAKRCFFAFSLTLCFVIAVAVTIVGITMAH